MTVRVLTKRDVDSLRALATRLARKGLAEESEVLLGLIRAGPAQRELSVSEAATLARRSSQTIRNWIKAGWLPARTDGTSRHFIPLDSLLPPLRLRASKPEAPAHLVDLADAELDRRIEAAIDRVRHGDKRRRTTTSR